MPSESQRQRDHEYRMEWVRAFQTFMSKAQPVIIVGFICTAVILSSRYLAGKTTFADVAFKVLADFKGLKALAMLSMGGVGAGGVIYGHQQKKLRIDEKKRNTHGQAPLLVGDTSKTLEKID